MHRVNRGAPPLRESLSSTIRRLFPEAVVTVVRMGDFDPAPLMAEEEPCIRGAVPKRRREFTRGRSCARAALERLGIRGHPLVRGPDRTPVWPEGIVGSITHCEGLTAAAVARRGPLLSVGIDAEPATPLESDLISLVCTGSEIRWMETVRPPPFANWAKLLFSAKEAVHKSVYPLSGATLDFREVTIAVHMDEGTFSAFPEAPARLELPHFGSLVGRFALTPGFVLTGAVVTGNVL